MNKKQEELFKVQMALMCSDAERADLENGNMIMSESDVRSKLFYELDRLICEAEEENV